MISTTTPLPTVESLSEEQKLAIKTTLWDMNLSAEDPEEQDDSRVKEVLELIQRVFKIL